MMLIIQIEEEGFELERPIWVRASDDTGWKSPTQYNKEDYDSGFDWTNDRFIRSQDDAWASSSKAFGSPHQSDWVIGFDFEFNIPEGSVIDGIEVRYDKHTSTGDAKDYDLYLRTSSGRTGTDHADEVSDYDGSDTDTYTLYGSSSDDWDAGLSVSDINSEGFGVDLSSWMYGTFTTVKVDHVQIKVYYSEGVSDTDPPTYDSLSYSDPLTLDTYQNVSISVYDESTISNVYLEYDSFNYTMVLLSGDTYYNDTWKPSEIGTYNFTIWMIDEYSNTNTTGIQYFNVTEDILYPPTYSNLLVYYNPIIVGYNEIIQIDVIAVNSSIDFVKIEIDGVNYSLVNLYNDTYGLDNWSSNIIGMKEYVIYMSDTNNLTTMVYGQIAVYNPDTLVVNVLGFIFLIGLIGAMLLCYFKFRVFLFALTIEIFSLIFGVLALSTSLPFQPYLPIFFIIVQSVIFSKISMDFFNEVKRY